MTYPPQQPGPGGWDQQPGNTPLPPEATQQPNAPQQQPGWYGNQATGWPQQPMQGEQPPPPPDWGGAEFGHATWTHEPGGFADVEPPKKSKTPLIIGLVVAAVVVLGGGGAGAYFLLNQGPGDPAKFAQDVVNKVNAHDFGSINNELCQANIGKLRSQLNQLQPSTFNLRVGKVSTQSSGTQASAELTGTYSLHGATQPVDQQMVLVVENGDWKICQLGQ
jgi:hypothetical protein